MWTEIFVVWDDTHVRSSVLSDVVLGDMCCVSEFSVASYVVLGDRCGGIWEFSRLPETGDRNRCLVLLP